MAFWRPAWIEFVQKLFRQAFAAAACQRREQRLRSVKTYLSYA